MKKLLNINYSWEISLRGIISDSSLEMWEICKVFWQNQCPVTQHVHNKANIHWAGPHSKIYDDSSNGGKKSILKFISFRPYINTKVFGYSVSHDEKSVLIMCHT